MQEQRQQQKRRFMSTLLWLGAAGLAGPAVADSYPSRPIRLVVPSAAGGSPDVLMRALGAEVGKSLGQSLAFTS